MVTTAQARDDIDDFCLTKTITYRSFKTTEITDLAYGTKSRTDVNYDDYVLKAQITIQSNSSRWVRAGVLAEGEAVGLLRYEYTEDANGNPINPALVPQINDEFVFLEKRYIIRDCTPATSEEDTIIGWDIRAKEQR